MAEYFNFEFDVHGPTDKVRSFLAAEVPNPADPPFRCETTNKGGEDHTDGTSFFWWSGQQAWDYGEEWVDEMRKKYPHLTIGARTASWEEV